MKKSRNVLVLMTIFYIVILLFLLILILPSAIELIRERMFEYWDVEMIVVLLMVVIGCLTALVLMLYTLYSKKNVKLVKDGSNINYMDDERSYLERQIIELNRKLVSTDERWKDAYHLIMSSHEKQDSMSGKVSPASFLNGFGIDIKNIEVQKDLAFVLTPFHEDFYKIYEDVCMICKEKKIKAIRGDEEYIANDILKHIIKHVVKARVIIAILDGRNPNVFYELGIAHTLGKPTILLANTTTQIPFDLQSQFLIFYEDREDLKKKLGDALLDILTLN